MRKLTFAMNVSLDGYIAAPGGDLGWSVPSDELFQWWSDRVAATGLALYGRRLEGGWRRAYAIAAMLSFYLLIFVLVAQLFGKVPALRALAPTQAEPPFAIAQGIVLAVFALLTWKAATRFVAAPHRTA